jgi:arylsulfatase B
MELFSSLFFFPFFFTFGQLASSPPPNILFILADDLGFADFEWHNPSLRTPNLRQLAFSPHSAILSNVYVGPLCSP